MTFSSCVGIGGHPCSFPSGYKDCKLRDPVNLTQSYLCTSLNDNETSLQLYKTPYAASTVFPWCYVHTYENNTGIPGHWGFVGGDCIDQMPGKERHENLANPSFDSQWTSRFFFVKSWTLGHCHTYTSQERHPPGREGHFYALIGSGQPQSSYTLKAYHVYIHSAKVMQSYVCRFIYASKNFDIHQNI